MAANVAKGHYIWCLRPRTGQKKIKTQRQKGKRYLQKMPCNQNTMI